MLLVKKYCNISRGTFWNAELTVMETGAYSLTQQHGRVRSRTLGDVLCVCIDANPPVRGRSAEAQDAPAGGRPSGGSYAGASRPCRQRSQPDPGAAHQAAAAGQAETVTGAAAEED